MTATATAPAAVDLSSLDLDEIVENIASGAATQRGDLLKVYRWAVEQNKSVGEKVLLETFHDTICPKLGKFLTYNTNLVFVAKATLAWVENGQSEASLEDLGKVKTAIARSWQAKYVNAGRAAVLPVLEAGASVEDTVEALKELCPERDLNADDIWKALAGKAALPAAAEFIAAGGDLSKVEQKNEQKYLDGALQMQAVLESLGATVTWK
jgi:hypothetical protein